MWLVITEVQSESFGLVTERRHYNARPIYGSLSHIAHVIFFTVECGIVHFLCMYSKLRHHPHLLGYLCAKFCFFHGLHCWPSPWRKSRNQSISHSLSNSITHPAYLMHQELKLSLRNIISIFQFCHINKISWFCLDMKKPVTTIQTTNSRTPLFTHTYVQYRQEKKTAGREQ